MEISKLFKKAIRIINLYYNCMIEQSLCNKNKTENTSGPDKTWERKGVAVYK